MAITAEQVKELRDRTGAGIMDCKKILTEAEGNIEKAIELLKQKGMAKAAKKAGRIAAEGLVEAYIHNGKYGALVEVNSETDFVANNPEYLLQSLKQKKKHKNKKLLLKENQKQLLKKLLKEEWTNSIQKFVF